jgi:WD40 repeat protein
MRIRDKVYVRSLKKHTKPVSVIRYFRKNNREEYLLSCEVSGGFVIIWDITNNFNIINCIQEQSAGKIYDALILFNLNNQDYILISSAMKEPIKLFGFRDNQKYYNIFGTEENLTNYMIPWTYDNNYYIIKLYSDISIHNIFKNECYAKLH